MSITVYLRNKTYTVMQRSLYLSPSPYRYIPLLIYFHQSSMQLSHRPSVSLRNSLFSGLLKTETSALVSFESFMRLDEAGYFTLKSLKY